MPELGGGGGLGFASGGVVTKPTRAIIGEGTESEAVMPLSRLEGMLDRERGRGSASRTGSQIERVEVDTKSLEDKLDKMNRMLRALGGDTSVQVGGETIVRKSRKADDRYVNAREVTK